MKKSLWLFLMAAAVILLSKSCSDNPTTEESTDGAYLMPDVDSLRIWYSDPATWPDAWLDDSIAAAGTFVDIGLLDEVPFPEDNAYSVEKALLGKVLFYDPKLSGSSQIACATCHDPELGWGDGRKTSFGHDRVRGKRNAPSILNAGYWDKLFWDGRVSSLEEQAMFPLTDHSEMNMNLDSMTIRLNRMEFYQKKFRNAFDTDTITAEHVAMALATFQRTIKSRKSRFDIFLSGNPSALSDQELQGLHLFRTRAGCINCHNTPLFSDQQFHHIGFTFIGREQEDLGLYYLTDSVEDLGRFRTPSLRDVTFTGPYMHNGSITELEEILDMYIRGMPNPIPKAVAKSGRDLPVVSPLVKKLDIDEAEKKAILAFLDAISTRPTPIKEPEIPL